MPRAGTGVFRVVKGAQTPAVFAVLWSTAVFVRTKASGTAPKSFEVDRASARTVTPEGRLTGAQEEAVIPGALWTAKTWDASATIV